jgi:hypothetical protein
MPRRCLALCSGECCYSDLFGAPGVVLSFRRSDFITSGCCFTSWYFGISGRPLILRCCKTFLLSFHMVKTAAMAPKTLKIMGLKEYVTMNHCGGNELDNPRHIKYAS